MGIQVPNVSTQTQEAVVVHVNQNMAAAKTGAVGLGAGASFITLNEWVAIATLIFILLQIGLLLPKYWQYYKLWRKGKTIKVELDK